MKTQFVLAIVLICLWAPMALAKTLVEIGTTADGSVYSADYDSVSQSGDRAEVWVYIDHSKDRTTQARSTRELWVFDCRASTSMTLVEVSYDPEGRVLSSQTWPDNSYFYKRLVPDTYGMFAKNLACSPR